MAGKDVAVKKYVVRLSGEERGQLEALIGKGKSPGIAGNCGVTGNCGRELRGNCGDSAFN
jgi:hypothetical protein